MKDTVCVAEPTFPTVWLWSDKASKYLSTSYITKNEMESLHIKDEYRYFGSS
jgi:hypothetical protein